MDCERSGGHRKGRSWVLKGHNGTGVGLTVCGYIEGAFYILLYPAFTTRSLTCQCCSLFLSRAESALIPDSVQLSASIGHDKTRRVFKCLRLESE